MKPAKTGKPGRPRKPFQRWPEGSAYATVHKTYREGRVVAVRRKLVHGTEKDLARALEASTSSTQINTAFVERHNGTDRCCNARKRRKTYAFSKDLLVHVAVGWWVVFCYNFHHIHRSLRVSLADGALLHRTPAMAAGLTSEPMTVEDILSIQTLGFTLPRQPTLRLLPSRAGRRARPLVRTRPCRRRSLKMRSSCRLARSRRDPTRM